MNAKIQGMSCGKKNNCAIDKLNAYEENIVTGGDSKMYYEKPTLRHHIVIKDHPCTAGGNTDTDTGCCNGTWD